MTGEPATYELFRSATRTASHMEMRDAYTPDDPDWRDWREGRRFSPAERWRDWFDLMRATTARGVAVRRLRIVSEPVSEYVRFEYDVTAGHNLAAGEQVRWLPRAAVPDLLVPTCDFWVFDEAIVVLNHFDGNGDWVGEERKDDPHLAGIYGAAFGAAWERATPHDRYAPAVASA